MTDQAYPEASGSPRPAGVPLRDRVNARRRPSGENVGAPLMPRKLVTNSRAPVEMFWM